MNSPTKLHNLQYAWNDEILGVAADAIAIYSKHIRDLETVRTTALFGMHTILRADQRHTRRLLQARPPKWWQGDVTVYISLKAHELSFLQTTRSYLRTLDDVKFSHGDLVAFALLAISHPTLRLPLPSQEEILE